MIQKKMHDRENHSLKRISKEEFIAPYSTCMLQMSQHTVDSCPRLIIRITTLDVD